MDLWIRSQDRENLMPIKEGIWYCYDEEKERENKHCIENYHCELGAYSTKERALEVLDEIQSILNLKDMYKNDRELVLKSWENVDAEQVKIVRQQMSVYEMPKE